MKLGWLELSLDVKDVAASRAFYEKLGWRLVTTNDDGMSATLQAGDCRLALYQGVLGPAENQLIFWQGDVEAVAETLAGAGARFVQALKRRDGDASFMVRDPDGQLLFVIREHGVTRDPPQEAPPDLDRGYFEVSLPVEDIARTSAFYEALGFQLVEKAENDRTRTLANRDCRIALYQGYLALRASS